MADETTLRRQLVRIETDQQKANQTRQTARAIQDQLEGMRAVVRDLSRDFGVTDDRLARYGDSARDAGRRIDDLAGELDQLRKDALAADRALDEMAEKRTVTVDTADVDRARREAAERARLYGDVESRTRAITGAVGYIGGERFERTANIGAELLAVNEAAGLLRQELPRLKNNLVQATGGVTNLTVAGGALSVAAVGLYLAFEEVSKTADKARGVVKRYLAEQEAITDSYDKTSAQLREEISDREAYLDALRLERENVQKLRDRMDATPLSETLTDVAQFAEALPIRWSTGIEDVTGQLDALDNKITEEQGAIDGLTTALDSGVIAANDMREAERELAAARDQIAGQLIQKARDEAERELRRADERQTIMPEDVDVQRREAEIRRQGLLAAIDEADRLADEGRISPDEYVAQWSALDRELQAVNETLAYLNSDLVTDAARQNELRGQLKGFFVDQVEGLQTFFGAVSEFGDGLEEARDKVDAQRRDEIAAAADRAAQYMETQAETEAKRELTLSREREDFLRKRALDWNKHYQDLAGIDRDFYDKQADVLADMAADAAESTQERLDELQAYNKESRRLTEDHQDELLRMQRDANRRAQDAIASLDAWGLRSARQDLEDQTQDAQREYEKQQERREEDFEQQLDLIDRERDANLEAGRHKLDDLRAQHERERYEAQRAFQDQLRLEDQERRIKLQRQQEDWRIEDQARLNHYLSQQGLTVQHYSTMTQITQAGMSTVQQVMQQAFQNIAGSMAPVGTSTPTGALPQAGNTVIGQLSDFFAGVAYG